MRRTVQYPVQSIDDHTDGRCVECGDRVTTRPDCPNGGLDYCADCGGVTCATHREHATHKTRTWEREAN